MKKIGVKFCGGCNPQIDRLEILKKISNRLPEGYQLITNFPPDSLDTAVLLCGCPAACAEIPRIEKMATNWVSVSGEMVDGLQVPESELANVILKKLAEHMIR